MNDRGRGSVLIITAAILWGCSIASPCRADDQAPASAGSERRVRFAPRSQPSSIPLASPVGVVDEPGDEPAKSKSSPKKLPDLADPMPLIGLKIPDDAPSTVGGRLETAPPQKFRSVSRKESNSAALAPKLESRGDQRFEPRVEMETSRGKMRSLPSLEILQTMPETVRHGQPIPVEIQVVNNGVSTVEKVMVTDELPDGVELLTGSPPPTRNLNALFWSLGDLEPGQQRTIHYKMMLTAAAPNAVLHNSAIVKCEAQVATTAKVVQPKLVVELDAPSTAVVHGKLVIDIRVTNKGNTPAMNVILRDPLPPELTHAYGPDLENEIGRLGVDETRAVQLVVEPIKAGKVVNRISVCGEGIPLTTKDMVVDVRKIEMAVAASSAKTRFLHRPCDFQFTVSNKGVAEAGESKLTARLPKGVSFVHASDAGRYDPSLQQVTWSVGPLRPGEKRQVAFTGVATQLGEQICRAILTGNGLQQESMCKTTVQGVSAIQLEVTDTVDPLEVGGETIYEIRLVNQGSATQTNVRLSCVCPVELKALDTRGPSRHEIHDGQIVFEPLPTLDPKAELIYKVKVRAAKAGDARFRVQLATDQQSRPIFKEEATTVYGDENN